MLRIVGTLVVLTLLSGPAIGQRAPAIFEQYRQIPLDGSGASRDARSRLLDKIKALPATEAEPAIHKALQAEDSSIRKAELIRLLWDYPTNDTVDLLDTALSDPDPETRKAAIQALRHFASRISRKETLPPGPVQPQPPILPNIAPHLIKASHDTDPAIRQLALFALADSRDPTAVTRLKEALKDPDPRTQLLAGSLLAEFDDPAGLAMLKDSILSFNSGRFDVLRFSDATHVISGLQRLTGQSFGPIPMQPGLSSGSQVERIRLELQFNELIQKWADWAKRNPTTAPAAE